MPSLALFPLRGTLMPGMRLPLLVFEDRYVALMQFLVDSQGVEPGFGVVAIRHGYEVGARANELYGVGCLAALDRIVQVTDALFLVLAHGARRFRLDGVDRDAGTAWTTGQVTWLEDRDGDAERLPDLAAQVREAVRTHGSLRGTEPAAPVPDDPVRLAYWAAESADLDRDDRQRLIEVDDTSARLALVRRIVQRESALASRLGVTAHGGPSPPALN